MNKRNLSLLLIVFLFLGGCGPKSTARPSATATSPASLGNPSPAATGGTTPQVTASSTPAPVTYPIVDSGQGKCYDNTAEIPCPPAAGAFFGQDAQYSGLQPAFTKNADATVTDKNTGLIWQQSPDVDGNGIINAADKLTFAAAGEHCKNLSLAGQSDWRLPDIKTLYSLMDFRGTDPGGASATASLIPFLDSTYFGFAYGDAAAGERTIDAQFASSSLYVDTNFADGSLKSYPLSASNGTQMKFFVLCVRNNETYGANHFSDNADETITDQATGLVWQKTDNTKAMNWQEALAYCEDLSLAGKDDWRLPDTKSLQSLLDYSRSPATSNSAAIDGLFSATEIKNEAGKSDYPYYWTGSTLANFSGSGAEAAYVAFGRALGHVNGAWVDVHGAGAQRSDPKSGDPANYPNGRGSQGEAVRILNYARCVRGGNVTLTPAGNPGSTRPAMTVTVSPDTLGIAGTPAAAGTPAGGGNTPPQEAIDACNALHVGDACHYDTLIGDINGTCHDFVIPGFQVLACIPDIVPALLP
jgi:Protein of unknown function (DUF1566)